MVVRLHGIVDVGPAQTRAVQGIAQGAKPRADGAGAIDPAGRTEVAGDGGQGHALHRQSPVGVHGEVRARPDQRRGIGFGGEAGGGEAVGCMIGHGHWAG